MPSVLLCSDEPVLAEGLARILTGAHELKLIACCSGTDELSGHLVQYQPDLVLIDLTDDVPFGLLKSIRETASLSKLVLWVRAISAELALQAMSVGVRGILRRTLPPETLVRCLTSVHAGELWFEKALTDTLMTTRRYTLTCREGQLIALLSQGLRNREIAMALDISEGSVKIYVSRLFQKLGVKDRFELAQYGLKNLATGPDSFASSLEQTPRTFFVDRMPAQSATLSGYRKIA